MLRDALREQTRAQHARLEQRLAIEQRVRDRDAYVELLGRFHGFYKPFETRLLTFARAFHEHGVMLSERMKTALLERDLHALGESEFELADSTFLPSIATFPRAVGCLYVMEGSTLGGQVIVRHVHGALGLGAADGAAFFASYGPRTGAMWQSFLRFLNALPFDAHDAGQAVSAACETFESLERWLCDQPMGVAVGA
jgi:heme oxygenase